MTLEEMEAMWLYRVGGEHPECTGDSCHLCVARRGRALRAQVATLHGLLERIYNLTFNSAPKTGDYKEYIAYHSDVTKAWGEIRATLAATKPAFVTFVTFVERVRTEARAAALEEAAKTFDTLPEYLEKWKEVARRLRALAQVHPPGQAGPPDDISQRVADALECSKLLVREALKLGRSIAGPDASLADVVIASGAAPVCATCGGERYDNGGEWPRTKRPCPDCARGGT